MNRQQRLFTREQIKKVNQGMIDRRRADISSLPVKVAVSIRSSRFSPDEMDRAFAVAWKKLAEV